MSAKLEDTLHHTKQEVLSQANDAFVLSKSTVKAGTYLYPPLGVLYLARHRSLWPPVLSRIWPCTLLSICVLVPMFFFTYLPQAALLTLLNGPLGPFNAVALVLSESGVIINALARSFLLDRALLDLFDATLVNEGMTSLVQNGRELKSGVSNHDGVKKLGKMVSKPLDKYVLPCLSYLDNG